jgi:hypothetical protein
MHRLESDHRLMRAAGGYTKTTVSKRCIIKTTAQHTFLHYLHFHHVHHLDERRMHRLESENRLMRAALAAMVQDRIGRRGMSINHGNRGGLVVLWSAFCIFCARKHRPTRHEHQQRQQRRVDSAFVTIMLILMFSTPSEHTNVTVNVQVHTTIQQWRYSWF